MNARQRWTLVLTSMAALMTTLDLLVVVTALNTIRLHLGASIAELDWTVNAYTLTVAVLLLTAAAVGDRLGRRRVLVAGLALFTASSAACALAPSAGALIGARAVQGIGTAMVLPQALSLLSAAFPPETRGRAMGIFAGITGLATLGGPVIGGAVAQGLAWQWIFWLNVPIGIALIPLLRRHVAEGFGPRTRSRSRLDVTGLALSGAAMLGLVWGLVRGNAAGWGSPQVYGPLAAGAAALAVFAGWERRARSPMVPVTFFRNGPFVSASASGFLMTGAMFGAVFFLAEYLQAGLGEGPLTAGVRMLPLTMALFVVAPVAGRLVGRLGERPVAVTGVLAQAAGFGWMALRAGGSYPALIPAMVLAGAGVSAALPAAQNAAVGAVPRDSIGVASGVFNAMRQLGGTFGIAIASAVFAAAGGLTSPATVSHGFRAALAAAAAISAAGALAGLGMRGQRSGSVRDISTPPAAAGSRPRGTTGSCPEAGAATGLS